MDNSRSRKNFEPGRSKQCGARFFPTPSRAKIQARQKPKSFRITAITKDPSEIAANICSQVRNAVLFPFRCPNPFQERLRIMPGRSDSLQIILVQFLQRSRLPMTVEMLTNLQSQ